MINFENKKVLFIDLDGTLIKTISGKTFPEDITDFRIQLPVLDKIKKKMPNLRHFYIVSNQGGIGKFISEADFKTKIEAISDLCFFYLNERELLMYYDYTYCASNDKNRGECDYFVDDVIILDKNFSKIGDIVKGTNKTAPHDTLYVKIVK